MEYHKHMDLVSQDEAKFKWNQLLDNEEYKEDEELEGGEEDMEEGQKESLP